MRGDLSLLAGLTFSNADTQTVYCILPKTCETGLSLGLGRIDLNGNGLARLSVLHEADGAILALIQGHAGADDGPLAGCRHDRDTLPGLDVHQE